MKSAFYIYASSQQTARHTASPVRMQFAAKNIPVDFKMLTCVVQTGEIKAPENLGV